jgi:hypothetical protein
VTEFAPRSSAADCGFRADPSSHDETVIAQLVRVEPLDLKRRHDTYRVARVR